MLNLTWLKTFVTLAREESFTRTARRLHMTQPGVSKHVAQLEDFFGVTLIDRASATFKLTDAGTALVQRGRELLEQEHGLRLEIGRDLPEEGHCRFASPGSFGMKMYSFLLELSHRHRGLIVHYYYRPNATIIEHVLDDTIDVGFVTERPASSELEARVIDHEQLVLLVPAGHENVSFDGLMQLGFVNHPDGHHHASRLLRENYPEQFASMEQFPVRAFNNQITRIPEPVALGLGFTVLPEYAARNFDRVEQIQILPLARPVLDPIYWIQRKGRQLPKRFAFILEAFARRYGSPTEP